ncbi:MAG: hypothetical protein RDU01_08160 [Thermodesulfovibrionales bacterium]|nr:hypothetical protein [Thermodesulfovibrionales bacterium]
MNSDLENLIISSDKQILILSAGMQRSGSTWLYNATRLLLMNSPFTREISSFGWIGDLSKLPQKRIMLIKIHDFNENLVRLDLPKIILYSYRDVRDALASSKRKWNQEPSLELADKLIQNDHQWRRYADFIMRYESMISDQYTTLTELAGILKINNADIQEIISQIEALRYENAGNKNSLYHMENLLHQGHITDGRHGSWKGFLDDKLLDQIERKHHEWFLRNNYPV